MPYHTNSSHPEHMDKKSSLLQHFHLFHKTTPERMTSGRGEVGKGGGWRQVEERQYDESGRIRINMSDIKWSRHISDISISNIVARPPQAAGLCSRLNAPPQAHI